MKNRRAYIWGVLLLLVISGCAAPEPLVIPGVNRLAIVFPHNEIETKFEQFFYGYEFNDGQLSQDQYRDLLKLILLENSSLYFTTDIFNSENIDDKAPVDGNYSTAEFRNWAISTGDEIGADALILIRITHYSEITKEDGEFSEDNSYIGFSYHTIKSFTIKTTLDAAIITTDDGQIVASATETSLYLAPEGPKYYVSNDYGKTPEQIDEQWDAFRNQKKQWRKQYQTRILKMALKKLAINLKKQLTG